jgi:hypothetical protein
MKGVISFFLRWWLKTGRYGWSKFRRSIFERGYLKTALPKVNSVEEVEACLKQITWTMDGPLHLYDSISYPQTVWTKKKDDCDGFSVLACELLDSLQPSLKPVLVTALMHPVKKSHTVCTFNGPDGTLRFFDNSTLKNGGDGYLRVVEMISKSADEVICWDVRDHRSFSLIEFHTGK